MQGIKFKPSKPQFDMKKSLSKLFDNKRDCFSRLRALKSICDAKDIKEVKSIFLSNYSVIYAVFHETFIILDSVKYNNHRKNATDDDRLLFYIFEKILILLPEFLERKWQMNSLIFIFKKCLHPTNLLSIRLEAMRLFLIYYQILGEINIRANQQIEILYASLIPGLITEFGFVHQHLTESLDPQTPPKYYGIRPFVIEPFILNIEQSMTSINSGVTGTINSNTSYPNYEYKHYTKNYFIHHLLDFKISQCSKIYWHDDRDRRHFRGFEFLFFSFSRIYLPYIFPRLATKNLNDKEWNNYTIKILITIYHPLNEMPKLRKYHEHYPNINENVPYLQSVIIQWLTKYLLGKEALNNGGSNNNQQTSTLTPSSHHTDSYSLPKSSLLMSNSSSGISSSSSFLSSSSTISLFQFSNQQSKFTNQNQSASPTYEYESDLFRMMLNSKRFYVDLILNLFHQSFLWPFTEDLTTTMRDVIKVYKQWIYKETNNPLPLFLAEPNQATTVNTGVGTNSPLTVSTQQQIVIPTFSNDDNVCAGYMNMLNIFIMSSSNVFLLEVPSDLSAILEKQVDVSKRVFNIYRYMVMKIEMERSVWENLVQVLIRVTECLINPQVPEKRDDTLGGRLAPALFQTLIVTWIKANLNITVSNQLWEQFHRLVSSLTSWEELINEWSQTMFILNRVMSRYVFHINLNELPMDKTISDRKRELRNKPKLNHIRSVSSNAQTSDVGIKTPQTPNSINQPISPNQSNHDQVSRTSSNQDSFRSDSKVTRLTSTDSAVEMNGCLNITKSHKISSFLSKISTPSLHIISVNRHQDYHKNCLINRVLKRSLSDSCLVLTVQQSLCPIRTDTKFLRRRSCHKSSSSRRYSNKKSNRHSTLGRNLPMIDDEEIDDDESCTLAESVDYQHNDIDSTGGGIVGTGTDGGDLSDNDDASLNEYLMDYLRRKTLYRANSTNDLYIQSSRNCHHINGNHHHHHHHFHHHNLHNHNHHNQHNRSNVNGSDSMAETLSLGASAPECNSLKETPLTFDSTSAASTCSSSMNDQQMSIGSSETGGVLNKHIIDSNPLAARPVLLGGQLRGWNAEAAAILWRRMLEILGDINDIKDPKLHQMAFECLVKITEDFTKIRDNITYLNSTAPESSQLLVPSLHYYTSWLFRATTLPQEFKSGRLLAYKLLCTIAMYRSEQELSKEFLILFYLALKRIRFHETDLINTIIKYCGSKFFSAALWGSSCLLFHFVSAANVVIGSMEVKTFPRTESLQLLGSLIGFFDVFSNVLCLKSSETLSLEPYTDLKDHVIEILIGASKRELTGLGRVISFCSLGIFLYREFMKGTEFNRIKEIIHILIAGTRISVKRPKSAASPTRSSTPTTISSASTTTTTTTSNTNIVADNPKFNNRVLCRVACDMLRLIADHAQYLVQKYPDFARRIIEGLCYTLELHIDYLKRSTLFKDFKNLLLCIMFCLSHWCMSVPKEFLLNTFVSEDYPGKFANSTNNAADFIKKSSPGIDESNPKMIVIRPCLLDLVISLYISLLNIDPNVLVKNQFGNDPYKDLLAVGDMDTIDYTVWNMTSQSNDEMSNNNDNNNNLPKNLNDQFRSPLIDQQISSIGTIKKAAHLIVLHFLNFLGHFPFPKLRTASLSALINENDDNPYVSSSQSDKVDFESLNAPNVLVFTINDTCLMSFVELPVDVFESPIWSKLSTSSDGCSTSLSMLPVKPIRIIIRNVLGKFAWDCMMLTSPLVPEKNPLSRPISSLGNESLKSTSPEIDDEEEKKNSLKMSLIKDDLELLVNSIQENAPECRPTHTGINNSNDFLNSLNQLPEAMDTVALLTNQYHQESQFDEESIFTNRFIRASPDNRPSPDSDSTGSEIKSHSSSESSVADLLDPVKAFQYCRQMIEQFGFLSWEKRKQIEILSKSQSTVREMRHLDNQQCRDKHKIAVIYVGPGQETRESILLNKSGSRAFEEFVSRLGWEVNLATHAGFMGGLQSNLSTGLTAPYYADSFNEVIFHVSTRLEPVVNIDHQQQQQSNGSLLSASTLSTTSSQPDKQQLMNMKMRHLGNDEVHIVWSEHYKEYRRSILATEFGDALIVIYPLPANTYPNLFRIQLMRKTEVPFFGPLFHGAVVHRDELPGLVRATAINASRGKRLNMDNYKPYFEERYDTIKNLSTKYRERTTFEEYANRIYAPRYDLLQSQQLYPTTNPANITECGFITLEDFVNHTMQPSNPLVSVPSSPISYSTATDIPTSPASSTYSAEISFATTTHQQQQQQQPSSPAIMPYELSSPLSTTTSFSSSSSQKFAHPIITPTNSSSSSSSLRGLRPNSRSSVK